MITHISPVGTMALLSQLEVDRLKATASSDLYRLYRNCSLAVLNSGSHTDSSKELLEQYKTFDINVQRRERGIKLELVNPPEHAFVDKKTDPWYPRTYVFGITRYCLRQYASRAS